MFKRLKHKILLFNMAILSLVMLLAFGAIYVLTLSNVQQENNRKLESIPTILTFDNGTAETATAAEPLSDITPPETTGASGQTTIRGLVVLPIDYSQSFTLFLQSDGTLQEVQSAIDMPSDIYERAAEIAHNSANGAGTVELQERIWQYKTLEFANSQAAQDGYKLLNTNSEPSSATLSQIVFLDVTDSMTSLRNLLLTFVAVGILMLVVLFGISWFFANRTIKPMEKNWDKQQRFIADASHELKTPLAIIAANIDALRIANNQNKWFDHIDVEVTRMGELIANLLYLAATESETIQKDYPLFDLTNVIEGVLASMEAVIFERNITLESSLATNLLVKGDEAHCKQVVLILLDNAAKYASAEGTIWVSLTRAGNHAVCSVRNSGTDIPADKLPQIFDRFYRVDDARSSETGGYGLGLAIAKAIIERQGGQITATSANGETSFSFTLKTH